MNDNEELKLFNNIVWKFKSTNTYPKKVYRDAHNSVIRTNSAVYGFWGYNNGMPKESLEFDNCLVSNKAVFKVKGLKTDIEPDFRFKFDSYVDDDLLELQIYVFEMNTATGDFKVKDCKWKKNPYLDDSINYFARAVINELDIQMLRTKVKEQDEKESNLPIMPPVKEKSFFDKCKDLIFGEKMEEIPAPVVYEKPDPYKYIRNIVLSDIVIDKGRTFIYDEMKADDPHIVESLEPLVIVIRII